MPDDRETHFDERSGVVQCSVTWGRWWQTVAEVHIEVDISAETRSKAVKVDVKPSLITVTVAGTTVIQGTLFDTVVSDETIWTLEDGPKPDAGTSSVSSEASRGKVVHVALTKLGGGRLGPKKNEGGGGEGLWEALLKGEGDRWEADAYTLHQMRQKLDLERFQIENPGFDFSGAKLAKCYDKVPGPK